MKTSIIIIFSLLALLCQAQSSDSGHSQAPIMGWASWNNYRININENLIKSQADAMINTGLKDAGYSFINIDDGYFGGRDANGNVLAHPEKFPGGMKSLVDYIHSKGLKAGIYSDAGINTCAYYWDNDTIGNGMGLYNHDEQDLKLFLNEWAYDFIKVDWCGAKKLGLDDKSRYLEIIKKAKAVKPDVVFNVCRWRFPGEWVIQTADSWRISGDISNKFNSILKIIDKNADLWIHCSKGHYNDMDMLQVGRGMTFEEDKAHFSMWCIMHSPLLLGNDLTSMSEETIKIITNKEIIALNQSSFVYQARRLLKNGKSDVWVKPLISVNSGEVAVALLNRSNQKKTISFKLETIGIDALKGYIVRDLWEHRDYSRSNKKTITMKVAKHGVVVLKIKGHTLSKKVF